MSPDLISLNLIFCLFLTCSMNRLSSGKTVRGCDRESLSVIAKSLIVLNEWQVISSAHPFPGLFFICLFIIDSKVISCRYFT
jgi:hypothetical protein